MLSDPFFDDRLTALSSQAGGVIFLAATLTKASHLLDLAGVSSPRLSFLFRNVQYFGDVIRPFLR